MNRKEFIAVLIITFIIVIVWIIADIYHARPSVPLDPKLKTILDPINPNFDQATLEKLKNLTPNPKVQLPQNSPVPSLQPSSSKASNRPQPGATESANR